MVSDMDNEQGEIDLNSLEKKLEESKITYVTLNNLELRVATRNISELMDNLFILKNKLIANKRNLESVNEDIQSLEWPPNLASEIKKAIMFGVLSQPLLEDIMNYLNSFNNEVRGINNYVKQVLSHLSDNKVDKIIHLNLLKEII